MVNDMETEDARATGAIRCHDEDPDMREYHEMKRQALLRTLMIGAAAFYAIACAVTTSLSLSAL
jgi:hypothetical protein